MKGIILTAGFFAIAASFIVNASNSNGGYKDVVCHKGHTIVISSIASLKGHIDHGDTFGTCPDVD